MKKWWLLVSVVITCLSFVSENYGADSPMGEDKYVISAKKIVIHSGPLCTQNITEEFNKLEKSISNLFYFFIGSAERESFIGACDETRSQFFIDTLLISAQEHPMVTVDFNKKLLSSDAYSFDVKRMAIPFTYPVDKNASLAPLFEIGPKALSAKIQAAAENEDGSSNIVCKISFDPWCSYLQIFNAPNIHTSKDRAKLFLMDVLPKVVESFSLKKQPERMTKKREEPNVFGIVILGQHDLIQALKDDQSLFTESGIGLQGCRLVSLLYYSKQLERGLVTPEYTTFSVRHSSKLLLSPPCKEDDFFSSKEEVQRSNSPKVHSGAIKVPSPKRPEKSEGLLTPEQMPISLMSLRELKLEVKSKSKIWKSRDQKRMDSVRSENPPRSFPSLFVQQQPTDVKQELD